MSRDLFSFAAEPTQEDRVVSVSELTASIKGLLEETFASVWVGGEISDLSRPQSGHCYFTLKDANAQIGGVVWRSAMARVKFDLHDGLEVVCRGHLDVYPPRGKYQLIVDSIQPRGQGALELALRQLRERLAKEGLFDPARKRPIPRFARRIAVVTSPTGAAIRDFLEVLRRRWRGVEVLIFPVRVQGEGAAEEIAAAIHEANRANVPIDCLVVTRGGGSLEDLWSFNEEVVVRAICASQIPVVSGVGHEIDVTLADLAADLRALTPSEAAERVAPAADELAQFVGQCQERLKAALRSRVAHARHCFDAAAANRVFRRPLDWVRDLSREVDDLESRLRRASASCMSQARHRVDLAAGRLESLSPLAVLRRGYSVTHRLADGRCVVRSVAELSEGDLIETRLADGRAVSRVEAMHPESLLK
jgi:exodeoxyribonuclease VII large subunit